MRTSIPSPSSPKLVCLATLLVASFALAGCFKSEIAIDVKDTNNVDVVMLMAFDTEAMAGFLPEGADTGIFDQLSSAPFPIEGDHDIEVEEYAEEGYEGAKYTIADLSLDEVKDLFGSETFVIEWGSGGGKFEAAADLRELPGIGDLSDSLGGLGGPGGSDLPPDAPDGLGDLGGLGEQMDEFFNQGLQDMTVSFAVTMPGSVESNNGTEVRGNTVVWEFSGDDMQSGQTTTMSATWGAAGGSLPWLWIGAAAGAVLVVVLIAFVVVSRRRKPEVAPAVGYPGQVPGAGPGILVPPQVETPAPFVPPPGQPAPPYGAEQHPVEPYPTAQQYPVQQAYQQGYQPPAPPPQGPGGSQSPVPDSYGEPAPSGHEPPPPPPPPPVPPTPPHAPPP